MNYAIVRYSITTYDPVLLQEHHNIFNVSQDYQIK